MIVHLVDGTYELFRHFHGLRRFTKGQDPPFGAVTGVLRTVVQMLEGGATHVGVATDHVIESFRNQLWPGYKTGAGIERALVAQFHPLEDALAAMGVAVWPMVELEADDGLASAARIAGADPDVAKVCIWTPDKDLAQCVAGDRIVQVIRKSGGKGGSASGASPAASGASPAASGASPAASGASPAASSASAAASSALQGEIRDAAAVRRKFGIDPPLVPDYLALVGDAADGFPGIPGIGPRTAAALLNRHGAIERFPDSVLGDAREHALLFKDLATLRTDAPLFEAADDIRWHGPTPEFEAWSERLGGPRLLERCRALAK
jgi:5'-3' exonuclease